MHIFYQKWVLKLLGAIQQIYGPTSSSIVQFLNVNFKGETLN